MSTANQPDHSTSAPEPSSATGSALSANFRLVSLCTLLSRVLGMVRDIAMASLFGAGPVLDAFTVAFRIPNLARQLFGEGALTSAFLPILVRERGSAGDDQARKVATAVFMALGAVLAALVAIAQVALWLAIRHASLSAPTRLLLELLVILTPYVLFICLAAQVSAVLHSVRRFAWPALLPVVLNLIWLGGVACAAQWIGEEQQARFIAVTVTLAGIVQLAIVIRAAVRAGHGYHPQWRAALRRARDVAGAMLPVLLGYSIAQLNSALDSVLAFFLAPVELGSSQAVAGGLPVLVDLGTASALYYGQRMYQFPLGVFGVALGTVLFPLLAGHAERNDNIAFRSAVGYGIRLTASIGIPAAAGLTVLSTPITRLLFQHGRFDAADAALTARMVAIYGSVVWAYIGLLIVNRAFYAVGDRLTPVRIGLMAVVINLTLNLTLVTVWGGTGLAVATAIASVCQCAGSLLMLQRRIGEPDWPAIGATTLKTLAATSVMVVVCLVLRPLMPAGDAFSERAIALLVLVFAGAVVFLALAVLFHLQEPLELLGLRRARR